jgi:hypothetical protein
VDYLEARIAVNQTEGGAQEDDEDVGNDAPAAAETAAETAAMPDAPDESEA